MVDESTIALDQEVELSTATTRGALPVGTWNLDPVHTYAGFAVSYIAGTFRGSFSPVDAKLEVAEDGSAILTGSVPVSGVKVQEENLTGHLQSPDFFDAERAPQITFSSNEVSVSGQEVTVTGDLTIRGIALPVTARGTVSETTEYNGAERISLNLEAQVDRTGFGINWNAPLSGGKQALANAVTITAELAFAKE
jgi:polyisoprenoid-binding protein YceI